MRCDYEKSWIELAAYVASKPGHGGKDLAAEMARIAERNLVDESIVGRVMRLYPDLLARSAPTPPAAPAADPDRAAAEVKRGDPGHSTTQEVTDGPEQPRDPHPAARGLTVA